MLLEYGSSAKDMLKSMAKFSMTKPLIRMSLEKSNTERSSIITSLMTLMNIELFSMTIWLLLLLKEEWI